MAKKRKPKKSKKWESAQDPTPRPEHLDLPDGIIIIPMGEADCSALFEAYEDMARKQEILRAMEFDFHRRMYQVAKRNRLPYWDGIIQ